MQNQVPTTRASIRKLCREARNALSPKQQLAAAEALASKVIESIKDGNIGSIGVYLASDGELSLSPLIDYCWCHNIRVNVPVLHPFSKGHIVFCDYRPDSEMVNNKYNIQEPKLTCQTLTPLHELDVILAPLVAFDDDNQRLGMGGGYYDRTLAAVTPEHKLAVWGVAHQCQHIPSIPCEPWDIPMDRIIAV